jgi:hypothetical protein
MCVNINGLPIEVFGGCKTVYPGSIPGVASNLRSRSEAKVARRSFKRRRAAQAAANCG